MASGRDVTPKNTQDRNDRNVAASGAQHSIPSAFQPFSGTLLCNRTARTLPHPLPTGQGLLGERLSQSYNSACAYCPSLAAFVSAAFFPRPVATAACVLQMGRCRPYVTQSDGIDAASQASHTYSERPKPRSAAGWPGHCVTRPPSRSDRISAMG